MTVGGAATQPVPRGDRQVRASAQGNEGEAAAEPAVHHHGGVFQRRSPGMAVQPHSSPEQQLHDRPWDKNTAMPFGGTLAPKISPVSPTPSRPEDYRILPATVSPTLPQAFSISFSESDWGPEGSAVRRTRTVRLKEQKPQPKTLGDAIAAVAESHDEAEVLAQVQDLLASGADPNASTQFQTGQPPLYWAAHFGLVQVTATLLENKAEVGWVNRDDGNSALHSAAIMGRHDVVELLAQANAPLDAPNKHGSTALHLAALKGHTATCQVLVDAGADIKIHSEYRYKNTEGSDGATAAQIAEEKRHRDIVALLA